MGIASAELINPFLTASISVIGMMLSEEPGRGQISVQPTCLTTEQVNVVLGVTGEVVGTVILGMSFATADKIASAMVGTPIKTFDAMAASAIAELGNMISGNALRAISDAGHVCDLAPPTLIRGTSVHISTVNLPAIVIPLTLSYGALTLTVSLTSQPNSKAA